MEAKQVLVVRKDLGMRKGKMIAQGAHASMAVFTRAGRVDAAPDGTRRFSFPVDEASAAWLTGRFKKIAVGVDSEAQLLAVHEAARAAGLPCALVQDAGLTEFGGVPTYTAVAVGPAPAERVDAITGALGLL